MLVQQRRNYPLNARQIAVRIGVVSLCSVLIWRFVLHLNGILSGDAYSRAAHFLTALAFTASSLLLIGGAKKLDRISWATLGIKDIRANVAAFFVGTLLWAIPAMIGLAICILVGWAKITVTTNLNQLLPSIFILYITVFLIEAFPEELFFRGYIYGYLNAVFPHWGTLIIQSVLFSVFAYFVGAIYSVEQLLFIPGYGFMLGYFRAQSGNVWTSVGFHAAVMTATQILNPIHGHFVVSGVYSLRFFAFNLLPYVLAAAALAFIYPKHNWRERIAIK